MIQETFNERKKAIIELKQGKTMIEVAQNQSRSIGWVAKWKKRYEIEGWQGLKDRSRRPKKHKKETSTAVKGKICQVRMELEAEAELEIGLKYIGGRAIRTRLKQQGVSPLPSISTIERVIRKAKLTKVKEEKRDVEISYPHLQPKKPHQLIQVDIVPHFLQGGQKIACFNALDVVSRYPTGQAFAQRRSQDAAEFLIQVWQEIGLSKYTQVDNEGCFSGGTTHPYVLGKVVRLALQVGTELLFSPYYHPKSNCYVERFHQDYNYHVWQATYLDSLEAVNQQAHRFFSLYRQRQDHKELNEQTPQFLHNQHSPQKLNPNFTFSQDQKLPLHEGKIHFLRSPNSKGNISVLNVDWFVPNSQSNQGVWATIDFKPSKTILAVFDTAPDNYHRNCLVSYPFPINEPVLPFPNTTTPGGTYLAHFFATSQSISRPAFELLSASRGLATRFSRYFFFTMF